MKNITIILIALFTFNFVGGQTMLSAGEIAITGFRSDNPDQFSFVLLTDVASNTSIKFTDNGWLSSGGFRDNEGTVTWTTDKDLPCGTEIIIEDTGSNTYSATIGTVNESNLGFAIVDAVGDQILAYQGSDASPTFIFAVNFDGAGWSDATSPNDTALPSGLTDGVDAVNFGQIDNAVYDCSITSDTSLVLASASNSSNWTTSNSPLTLGECYYSCAACSGATVTWNGAWVGGFPNINSQVIISADYFTSVDGSFEACSLNIDSGVALTINNSNFVHVENDVTVNGELYVESSGNFVQNNDDGNFSLNVGGVAQVNKTTPFKSEWYYYTYWSSPVKNQLIRDAFQNVDGDRRFWFNAANFHDGNGDDIDDDANDWQRAPGNTVMTPGVGYASTEARLFFGGNGTATFEGEFNTGDIPVAIDFDPANPGMKWNFIGNPYPSAIDFNLFFNENSGLVEGTAYFWSQASAPSSSNPGNEQLNFSINDYAMYASGSSTGVAGASGVTPNQFVPSAQGFFIEGNTIGTAKFTNAMRMADETSNNQFFKGTRSKKSSARNPLENRLWINLTSDNGVFNQIAVAYIENATDGDDGSAYDAKRIVTGDTPAALYTKIEHSNKKFAILSKNISSINEDEAIKIGFKTKINVATLYSLSIAKMEGDFLNSHSVFVKDNLLNKAHDLTVCDYTFTSETGEFNKRFEIVFKADALSTADALVNPSQLKIVELENDNVQFTAPNGLQIKTVSVFDLFGRQLYQFNGQNDTEIFNMSSLSSSVFVAEVVLSNGSVISKKAIKK